jgi:hypothetical protein
MSSARKISTFGCCAETSEVKIRAARRNLIMNHL